jgi:hypothetical protein
VVNREEPQSKQIETFGNANTPGLSMFLMPLKWISISVVNSTSLADVHTMQDITHLS